MTWLMGGYSKHEVDEKLSFGQKTVKNRYQLQVLGFWWKDDTLFK
jgi:hypothetical protein